MRFPLHQTATYFAPGVPNGFGKLSFDAVTPVIIAVRWEGRQVLFRDAQGRESMSKAIIYTETQVELGGFLALGNVGTATGLDPRATSANEIRQIGQSPSLRAAQTLFKAML